MFRLLFILLLACLFGGITAWVFDHPGNVDIKWLGWQIDIAIGNLMIMIDIFFACFFVIFSFYRLIMRMIKQFKHSRLIKRQKRIENTILRGLTALTIEDGIDAKHQALVLQKLSGADNRLAQFFYAQAARISGENDSAASAYHTLCLDDESRLLGLRGLSLLAHHDGDLTKVNQIALSAQEIRRDVPWLIKDLFNTHVNNKEWQKAEEIIKQAINKKMIPTARGQHYLVIVLLEQAQIYEKSGNLRAARLYSKRAYKLNTLFVPSIVIYARILMTEKKHFWFNRLLKKAWRVSPHPDIARIYCSDETQPNNWRRVTALTKQNPEHIESKILLAEQAVIDHQWRTAATLLNHMNKTNDLRVLQMKEIVVTVEKSGESNINSYERGKIAAWLCDKCGHSSVDCYTTCPSCNKFGSGRFDSGSYSGKQSFIVEYEDYNFNKELTI